jgi:hypothetical protein
MKVIRVHFAMQKVNERETLARLVDEGGLSLLSEPVRGPRRVDKSFLPVQLAKKLEGMNHACAV